MSKKVCVLSEGNWGTAIATLIANNGFEVNLWCHDSEIADSINKHNINQKYLPNIKLNSKIKAFTDLHDVIRDTEYIFEAIPVKFLRHILNQIKSSININQKIVILSKGLEQDTFLLPSQIIDDVFDIKLNKIIISGPSFAHDLNNKSFTMVDAACQDEQILKELVNILNNKYFKIKYSSDIIGVQAGGAFKNIIALILGMAIGNNCSDNTKAYIFTKGLHEISLLTKFLGGRTETVYGLSGLGDLVLTCYGKHSKNLNLGLELAKLKDINSLQYATFPEGINTLESVYKLIIKNNLDLSLIKKIYKIIFEQKDFDIIFE